MGMVDESLIKTMSYNNLIGARRCWEGGPGAGGWLGSGIKEGKNWNRRAPEN